MFKKDLRLYSSDITSISGVNFRWPWTVKKYKNLRGYVALLGHCSYVERFVRSSKALHIFIVDNLDIDATNVTCLYNKSIYMDNRIIIGCTNVEWLKNELLTILLNSNGHEQKITILLKYNVECDLSDYHDLLDINIIRGPDLRIIL